MAVATPLTPELSKPVEAKPQAATPETQVPVFSQTDLPKAEGRLGLRELAMQPVTGQMKENEARYLDVSKNESLRQRYDADTTSRDYVMKQIKDFAKARGVDIDEIPPELQGVVFAQDQEGRVMQSALRIVERFFNSAEASINPEKNQLLRAQTEQYLQLVQQAQTEGSVSSALTGEQVYRLVAENLAAVAIQDRAASENLLGDHGVRHLVGHNIRASMQLADSLVAQGVQVTTMDRLVMHQAMLYHDLGYSMSPVRDPINAEGIKGQDSGHNVLAAKFAREQAADSSSSWHAVFGSGELSIVHRSILYHDKDTEGKAGVNFSFEPAKQSPEARNQNIESIVRTADNTHAFEDKLPEILYRVPDTLKYMRLMKAAGEIGDQTQVEALKKELGETIGNRSDVSEDDKLALQTAIGGLSAESYNFSVGRICGNKPEYSVVTSTNGQGGESKKVQITIQESAIHQEVVGLFGVEAYKQLVKFIADNVGKDKANLKSDQIEGDELVIKVMKGESKATERTDYQAQIDVLLKGDPAFMEFVNKDNPLSAERRVITTMLKVYQSGEASIEKVREHADGMIDGDVGTMSGDQVIGALQQRAQQIQEQQRQLFNSYRNGNKET